jgi:hypothetical protein
MLLAHSQTPFEMGGSSQPHFLKESDMRSFFILFVSGTIPASESSAFPIPTRLRFELVWLAPFRGLPQPTGSAGGH